MRLVPSFLRTLLPFARVTRAAALRSCCVCLSFSLPVPWICTSHFTPSSGLPFFDATPFLSLRSTRVNRVTRKESDGGSILRVSDSEKKTFLFFFFYLKIVVYFDRFLVVSIFNERGFRFLDRVILFR